jgi:hypothetical protein
MGTVRRASPPGPSSLHWLLSAAAAVFGAVDHAAGWKQEEVKHGDTRMNAARNKLSLFKIFRLT